MPLLTLSTSAPLDRSQRDELLAPLSRIVATCLGKPERYVMVSVAEASMAMGGSTSPCASVLLHSIGGLSAQANRALSASLCELLQKRLGIPPDRVFIVMRDVDGESWGWNAQTFG